MILGVAMIILGVAMAAFDRKMERQLPTHPIFALSFELVAFLLVVGGIMLTAAAV